MAELGHIQGAGDGEAPAHRPVVELLLLAGPTVAQMASYTVMQFIDKWILSHIGVEDVTAAGNLGLWAFAVIAFGMGVLWVVNTLVSQDYGRKSYPRCGRYLWQGIWFSVLYSALMLPALPWARPMLGWFGHTPGLAAKETVYFQIVMSATLIKMLGTCCGQFLLAINRPGRVLTSAVCGVTVNAVAAWVMVLGRAGCPSLGVAGAAWAQNIGVSVETAVLILFVSRPAVRRMFGATDWRLRWRESALLLRLGLPSGVQFVADVMAWALFALVVIGKFGNAAMAANTFVFSYMPVSFMPAVGVGVAVTSLVGRYIGRGQPEIAQRRAHLGFVFNAVYMVCCGLVFYLFREELIRLFLFQPNAPANDQVLAIGKVLLTFAAVYQFFDALYVTYGSALRGAGDTLFPAVATGTLCWSITVVGGYLIAVKLPSWGPAGPWTAATAYGIILGVVIFVRFVRGGWKSIHLEEASSPAKVEGSQQQVLA